jgi:hypothetical protein
VFRVPVNYPRSAIRRIRSQTDPVPRLKSCQQETYLRTSNYADIGTYLATPGASVDLILTDVDQILPYSTLTFNVDQDSAGGVDTAYEAYLFLLAADTTRPLAAVRLAGQINAWVGIFGAQYPDLSSLRAVAQGDNVIIYMPWGMLGLASGTYTGPEGVDGFTAGNPGVDNPLAYGILGKRRHIFLCVYPFRGDYYERPVT